MNFVRSDWNPIIHRNDEGEVIDVQILSSINEVSKRYAFHNIIESSSGFSNHFIVEDFDLPLEAELEADIEEVQTLFYLRQSFFTDRDEYLLAKDFYQRLLSYSSSKFVKPEFQPMSSMYFNECEAQGFFEVVCVFSYGEADQIDVQRIEPGQIDQFIRSIILLLINCKATFQLHHSNISLSNIVLMDGELKISGFKARHEKEGGNVSWKMTLVRSLGLEKLDMFLLGALWMTFLGNSEAEVVIRSMRSLEEVERLLTQALESMPDFEKRSVVSDLLSLKGFRITCLDDLISELEQMALLKDVHLTSPRRLTNLSSEFSHQSLSNIFQRPYLPSVSVPDDNPLVAPDFGEPLLDINDDNFTLNADIGTKEGDTREMFGDIGRLRRATEAQRESLKKNYSERRMTLDGKGGQAVFPSHKRIGQEVNIKEEECEAEEKEQSKGHDEEDEEEVPQKIALRPTPNTRSGCRVPETSKINPGTPPIQPLLTDTVEVEQLGRDSFTSEVNWLTDLRNESGSRVTSGRYRGSSSITSRSSPPSESLNLEIDKVIILEGLGRQEIQNDGNLEERHRVWSDCPSVPNGQVSPSSDIPPITISDSRSERSRFESIDLVRLNNHCSDKLDNKSDQNDVALSNDFKDTSETPLLDHSTTFSDFDQPPLPPAPSPKCIHLSKVSLFEVPRSLPSKDSFDSRADDADRDIQKLRLNAFKKKELQSPISPYYQVDDAEHERIVDEFKETFVAMSKESGKRIDGQKECLKQKELERLREERVIQERIDRQLERNLKRKKQRAEEEAASRVENLKKSNVKKKSKVEFSVKSLPSTRSSDLETPRTLSKQRTHLHQKPKEHPTVNPERAFAETVSRLRSHLEGSSSSYKEKYYQFTKRNRGKVEGLKEQGTSKMNPFSDFDSAQRDEVTEEKFFISEKMSEYDICSSDIILYESGRRPSDKPLPLETSVPTLVLNSTLTFGQDYHSLSNFTSLAKPLDSATDLTSDLESLLQNHTLPLESRKEVLRAMVNGCLRSEQFIKLPEYILLYQGTCTREVTPEEKTYLASLHLVVGDIDMCLRTLESIDTHLLWNSIASMDVYSRALIVGGRPSDALPILGRLLELLLSSSLEDGLIDYFSSVLLTFVQVLETQGTFHLVSQLLESILTRLNSLGGPSNASFGSSSVRSNRLLLSLLMKYTRCTFSDEVTENVPPIDYLSQTSPEPHAFTSTGHLYQINHLFNDPSVLVDIPSPSVVIFFSMYNYITSVVKPKELPVSEDDMRTLASVVLRLDCSLPLLMYTIEVTQSLPSSSSARHTLFLLMVRKAEMFFREGEVSTARHTLMVALDLTSFCTELVTDEDLSVLLYDIAVCALSDNDVDEAVFFLKSARSSTGSLAADLLVRVLVLEVRLKVGRGEKVEEELGCLREKLKRVKNEKLENVIDYLAVVSGNGHLVVGVGHRSALCVLLSELMTKVDYWRGQDIASRIEVAGQSFKDLLEMTTNRLLPLLKELGEEGVAADLGLLLRDLLSLMLHLTLGNNKGVCEAIQEVSCKIGEMLSGDIDKDLQSICSSVAVVLSSVSASFTSPSAQSVHPPPPRPKDTKSDADLRSHTDIESLKRSLLVVFQKSNFRRKLRCRCFDYSKKHPLLSKSFLELSASLHRPETTLSSFTSHLSFIERTLLTRKCEGHEKYHYFTLLIRCSESTRNLALKSALMTSHLCIHDLESILGILELLSRSDPSTHRCSITDLYLLLDMGCPSLLQVLLEEVVPLRPGNLLKVIYDRLKERHALELWLYPFNGLIRESDHDSTIVCLSDDLRSLRGPLAACKDSKVVFEISSAMKRERYSINVEQLSSFKDLSSVLQSFMITLTICKAMLDCLSDKSFSFIEVIDSLASMLEVVSDPRNLHPHLAFTLVVLASYMPPNFTFTIFEILSKRVEGVSRFFLAVVGSWLATISLRENAAEVSFSFVKTSLTILGSIETVDLTLFPDFAHKVTPQSALFGLLTMETILQMIKGGTVVNDVNLKFMKKQSILDVDLQLMVEDLELAVAASSSEDKGALEGLSSGHGSHSGAICFESSKQFRRSFLKDCDESTPTSSRGL